jgi:hypothetical protein
MACDTAINSIQLLDPELLDAYFCRLDALRTLFEKIVVSVLVPFPLSKKILDW